MSNSLKELFKIRKEVLKLIENNIHCVTLPNEKGEIINPSSYFSILSRIAEENPSKALGLSMHLYTTLGLNLSLNDKEKRDTYNKGIREKGYLFASLNEPSIYFTPTQKINPTQFPIKFTENSNGYIVNGVKKFVSFEPFVKYLPVYCLNTSNNKNEIIVLVIDKHSHGINIKKDWDSISMQESWSNSIEFKDVFVPYKDRIFDYDNSLEKTKIFNYLFRLSICSVYYGMAKFATDYITDVIKSKEVPHWNLNLASFPGVQFTYAEMVTELDVMHSQIEKFCRLLEEFLYRNNEEADIDLISLITKYHITMSAESLVNKAMKIQGMPSLFKDNKLAKLYTDIKASQFHPPQEDITKELIAKSKLGIITIRKRWC